MEYGVSKSEARSFPSLFVRIHTDRRTAYLAITLTGGGMVPFTLLRNLGQGAGLASGGLLVVFVLINSAPENTVRRTGRSRRVHGSIERWTPLDNRFRRAPDAGILPPITLGILLAEAEESESVQGNEDRRPLVADHG